jgi:hypothetical protein
MIYGGSLVKSKNDFLVYFGVTGVWGTFAYLLFFCKFEVRGKKKIDVAEEME